MKKLSAFDRRKERNISRVKNNNAGKKPILNVFKSNKNIYAQIVDLDGKVLAFASSKSKELSNKLDDKSGLEIATEVGKIIAENALKNKVDSVVFNKGPYLYTGRVKALADSARESGLKF